MTPQNQAVTVAALYLELENAEKSADVLEDRLFILERRLDELLTALENEADTQRAGVEPNGEDEGSK
jgi:hypothetical protein